MSEQFTLTLRPLPHAVPVDVRLRRLLKTALRSFGFRAVDVREVSPVQHDGAAAPVIPCKPARLTRQRKAGAL